MKYKAVNNNLTLNLVYIFNSKLKEHYMVDINVNKSDSD